jgi:Protein of unknown function (DUF3037)
MVAVMFKATYSILRYVPRILREEFVNVGVLLVCPELGFKRVLTLSHFGEGSRVKALRDTDGWFVQHAVGKLRRAFDDGSVNDLLDKPGGAPLEAADVQALFEMYRVNNLQLSEPRLYPTNNPEVTLLELFTEFVGEQTQPRQAKSVTRRVIKRDVHSTFMQLGLLGEDKVMENWELPTLTKPTVDLAYKNDVWHCYQAVSFATHERDMTYAVNAYRQAAHDARASREDETLRKAEFMVLGFVPQDAPQRVSSLLEALRVDEIAFTDYREAPNIAQDIARDLQAHQSLTVN